MTSGFPGRGAAGFFPSFVCVMGLCLDSCLLSWGSYGNPMVLVCSEKGSMGSEAAPMFTAHRAMTVVPRNSQS